MTLEKNTLLHNRYRVIEILGQGGMGSVYRAVDENLGSTVALKENLFTTDEYARQFRLEAVILANLRHPNLPRVYDHFVLGELGQYLVMDFIEGEDLRQRMERMGTISEDDAILIGASISDALTYLHTRKPPILHRDIKPGNVKITPDGHIFLVDFGLAKIYQNAVQATTTGARAMTPGYSPPEQYGTARTDSRTDIYSLGATLYAALCGIIPEDGLARAMDNAQLTPLRKRNPKISRRVAAAIEKAMSIDPSDRFQLADDFKSALLSSKSKTQQVNGAYVVSPPPAESNVPENSPDAETMVDKPPKQPTGPVYPPAPHEDKPFVSPVKKQKERERKQRWALVRFVLILLLLVFAAIPFFVPDVLPAEIRNMVLPLVRTSTLTPTITASPLPTDTPEPKPSSTSTQTASPAPTSTNTPTFTPLPNVTEAVLLDPTVTSTEALPTSASFATPVGGSGGQIAYVSNRSGLPQVYLADFANEVALQITDMAEGACQPAWSPDGERLIFISPCKGMDEIFYNSSLYLVNADGSNLAPLATVPGGDFDPAWSPDGKSIAFTSLRTGQMEIFILNLETQNLTQITKGAKSVESRQPAWSPDGTQLAYTVKRFGVYQIWLMNSDGSDPKQIVRSGTKYTDYLPTWSNNGELIIYNQRCATSFCLPYAMRISAVDRSVEQGTTLQFSGVLTIEDVEYSPDGFWLIYEGESAGENKDIYYMKINGADRTRLTLDGGLDFDPTWRPSSD